MNTRAAGCYCRAPTVSYTEALRTRHV